MIEDILAGAMTLEHCWALRDAGVEIYCRGPAYSRALATAVLDERMMSSFTAEQARPERLSMLSLDPETGWNGRCDPIWYLTRGRAR